MGEISKVFLWYLLSVRLLRLMSVLILGMPVSETVKANMSLYSSVICLTEKQLLKNKQKNNELKGEKNKCCPQERNNK